ncbi:Hypothetical protein (Fragment), partial [Durusdinium trenchii]
AGSTLLPASALPPHALPGVLVRRYTFLISFLWIVSGITHGIRWTSNHVIIAGEPFLDGHALQVQWPKPAHLFEVNGLECNGSQVLLQNRFSHFRAVLGLEMTHLEELQELQELPSPGDHHHLQIPSQWLHWSVQPCNGCAERWAAGWASSGEIFVGVASNESNAAPRLRYALKASLAS